MTTPLPNHRDADKAAIWTYEVPDPPPLDGPWIDVLRWLVIVMDHGPHLAFSAGCLAYAVDHGGCMTDRQVQACNRVLAHVLKAWAQGTLACQVARDHPLRDAEPAGFA